MQTINLDGTWLLQIFDRQELQIYPTIQAQVPGSVYRSLLDAGHIADPFWRDNELTVLPLMEHRFVYTRDLEVSADLLACDGIILRCEGLDTLADILVNGQLAAHTENMHRTWDIDVQDLLHTGTNRLEIRLASPTRYIRDAYEQAPLGGSDDAMRGFPYLRKAHCMFGWDWGPRLPDAGIWRSISLIGIEKGHISQVRVTQQHEQEGVEGSRVILDFDIETELWAGASNLKPGLKDTWRQQPQFADPAEPEMGGDTGLSVDIVVTAADGTEYRAEPDTDQVIISQASLWWPHGYGSQPLYTVTVNLRCGQQVLDVWERRIGLRTMTVRREKDEWGESFEQVANGMPFFAMGADYIPEDNLLSRVTPERTRQLLEDCVAANFNAIRVWGGGYYPDDWFYDTCDELGLVVWQDFMFACANYDLTREFAENIQAEFVDNVRRLRHHASLGLWCGNNEMEMFMYDNGYGATPKLKGFYIRMYEHILPEVLAKEDPVTFYWPASPSSGGSFDEPNDPNRGDVHYWEVWHGNKPFSDYRNFHFRYASEFGFQSFPSLKTVESFTEPEDRNIFTRVMEMHQRNKAANGKIMQYMASTYLYPKDFDHLLYASQLLQAEAIQYGVEHWRRNRGRCMGAIYWQLNDCWPVASWASIDYFGRWKALHYYARRFFAPVMLSCCEEGEMTQRPFVVMEPEAIRFSARLSVANETRKPVTGTVRWALRDTRSNILQAGEQPVEVAPLTSSWLDVMTFPDLEPTRQYLSYELIDESGQFILSSGQVLFCAPKHFEFADPQLSYEVVGDHELIIRSTSFARSIEIDCPDSDFVLSDNYFDLNAGEKKIKILRGELGSLRLRSVYDIAR